MGDYPAYPAYQDCGIEWLGEVPAHWDVGLIKRYFHVELGKMLTRSISIENGKTKPYLRAANIHWGRTLLEDINEMEFSPSQLSRYRVKEGDLLVTEGGVTVGRSAIWQGELQECYYQNSINRVRPRTPISASPYFLFYWMYFTKTNGYIDLTSNIATFGHLTQEKLQSFPIVMPPLPEQQTIARFLDHKTAQIDALIAAKQALLAKLAEKRTALISHAVTKGLDPAAPMKDSGIDWLGEIPAHWDTCHVKRLAMVSYGVGGEIDRGLTDGTYLLSLPNITKEGTLLLEEVPVCELSEMEKADVLLHKGDLLFNWRNGSSEHLGKTAYFDLDGEWTHVSFLLRLRFDLTVSDSRYFRYLLNGLRITGFFSSSKAGVNNTFNLSELTNLWILNPPKSEQEAIAQQLDEHMKNIAQQATKIQAAIDTLQEYRTALITHAVTGKIDVRGVTIPTIAPNAEIRYDHAHRQSAD